MPCLVVITKDDINAFSNAAQPFWKIAKGVNSAGLYLRILRQENIYVNPVLNKRVSLIEYQADRTSPAPPWKNRILFSQLITLILFDFLLRCLSGRNDANLTIVNIFFMKCVINN